MLDFGVYIVTRSEPLQYSTYLSHRQTFRFLVTGVSAQPPVPLRRSPLRQSPALNLQPPQHRRLGTVEYWRKGATVAGCCCNNRTALFVAHILICGHGCRLSKRTLSCSYVWSGKWLSAKRNIMSHSQSHEKIDSIPPENCTISLLYCSLRPRADDIQNKSG